MDMLRCRLWVSCERVILMLGLLGLVGSRRFICLVISYLTIHQCVGSVMRNIVLRRSCAWGWRAIGSWCLEIVSVVAWGEMRRLADTSGAFVRFGLIPRGVILPWDLLQVSVSVAATSRLAGSGVKRARFRETSRRLLSYMGGYISFIRGPY